MNNNNNNNNNDDDDDDCCVTYRWCGQWLKPRVIRWRHQLSSVCSNLYTSRLMTCIHYVVTDVISLSASSNYYSSLVFQQNITGSLFIDIIHIFASMW